MARVTADTADDIGGEVAGLRTVVLAVTNLATILASLIFIVAKSTVQCSELTKLIAFELVLAFRNRRSLCNFVGTKSS